ncbi:MULTISPECIES: hypothetical protein [unclassified Methylophaga]|jgi:hypothetical protein|uniref:hypothetical protein n=1 Tax=unclassified Methylophaga TaxID=2629249 RepID=UPI000E9A233D|nr:MULTISPECIES: hypothetical protein [unclassified Methylophaga]HBX59868.1 hypothetical protein [Methylophaga sp.]|tara:strand:- start:735 stop:926 length:192 start_codon:yes stop_codon:yes gene_type:complete
MSEDRYTVVSNYDGRVIGEDLTLEQRDILLNKFIGKDCPMPRWYRQSASGYMPPLTFSQLNLD